MDVEIPVLSGNLNIPTQSGFSLNRISKKKSGQRYCLLFKSSRHGIERLEICESKDDKNPKIITLEDCVKITQEPSPVNSIQIVKKTGTLTLNALTDDDLKEWITALQSVAFRDKGGGTLGRNAAIEEHNDLYCSSYGDGLFSIKLIPSETSLRCNLESKIYMLHLTATDLQLKSAEDLNIIVAKWPYRYIRKYGYRNGNFTFEAGRKCDTGEGVFILDHTNPQDVFRCMSSKMKSMKKLISGDSLNSLDCGENQLSAALSMEAGSRSPLPPSPNLLNHSDFDITNNTSLTQSCASIRDFLSSNDSLNNVSTNSTTTIPVTKHIPNKPPRKDLKPQPSSDSQKKLQKYEPVTITNDPTKSSSGSSVVVLNMPAPNLKTDSNATAAPSKPPNLPVRNDNQKLDRDYESIETITDAWRTLGLGEVKHTEHVKIPEDDLIDFVWQRTQSQRGENNRNNLIIDDIDPDATYDRLDFMPPNSKNSSNQYKTIVTVAPPGYKKQNSAPPVPNDYELIENPDMQACRLADDSYLGYGVLRKPSIPGPQVATSTKNNVSTTMITEDPALDHRSYNGLSYAIVSKPKRV